MEIEPDATGVASPTVTVRNSTDETVDYEIAITVDSEDGATHYDDSTVTIEGVAPGQTATADGSVFQKGFPPGAKWEVVSVDRTPA